jgi:hypothetical protein
MLPFAQSRKCAHNTLGFANAELHNAFLHWTWQSESEYFANLSEAEMTALITPNSRGTEKFLSN